MKLYFAIGERCSGRALDIKGAIRQALDNYPSSAPLAERPQRFVVIATMDPKAYVDRVTNELQCDTRQTLGLYDADGNPVSRPARLK
jgi:hypothetical protein